MAVVEARVDDLANWTFSHYVERTCVVQKCGKKEVKENKKKKEGTGRRSGPADEPLIGIDSGRPLMIEVDSRLEQTVRLAHWLALLAGPKQFHFGPKQRVKGNRATE